MKKKTAPQRMTIDKDEIIKNINKELERSFCFVNDKRVPPVCFCCDRFINPSNICHVRISEIQYHRELIVPRPEIPESVKNYYKYMLETHRYCTDLYTKLSKLDH